MSELLSEDAKAKENNSFAVVGIAVESPDIPKMKYFFQEMPSDVLECYDTCFAIICEGGEEDIKELEEIIERNAGGSIIMSNAEDLLELEPNRIYLMSKKIYGGSFNDFFERLVGLYGKTTVAVLMSEEETDGIKSIRRVKKAGGMSVLCEAGGKR